VKREVFVNTTQTGDEVVFESSDGTFGGIAAVNTGWDKLEVDVFIS
jgi:hypothetical protein